MVLGRAVYEQDAVSSLPQLPLRAAGRAGCGPDCRCHHSG